MRKKIEKEYMYVNEEKMNIVLNMLIHYWPNMALFLC